MFTLRIKDNFSAAHFLPKYPYECKRMHGHNYVVEVFVSGNKLNSQYMLIDFKVLKKLVKHILEDYDHFLLNDLDEFKDFPPTAEIISKNIFKKIKKELSKVSDSCFLTKIRIWESENSYVEFYEE